MKILRYLIAPQIEMPTGAILLDAQAGTTGLSGWFLCDPTAPLETRTFVVVATGQELPEAIMDCLHLATIKALLPFGDKPVPTAIHIFDTTATTAEIPGLAFGGKPGNGGKPGDPADWWK